MQYIDEVNMKKLSKVNTSSWEAIKNNVFFRVVNEKCLDKYGENIAYVKFLDLAITFSVQEKKQNTLVSHMLTKEELASFNVNVDEVKQAALYNTENNRKRRIMTFKQSFLKDNLMYPIMKIPEGLILGAGNSMSDCGIIEDVDLENECDNILIVCNKNNTFGASYIAVPKMLEEVYNRFGEENFYIIPLSVHQIMCIRRGYVSHEGKKPNYEVEDDLLDMLEDFNDNNNKSWKDILSYKIYYYFGDDGKRVFPIE